MLGIIIGIMAVVAMMSLGAGAERLIVGEIMTMGSNNIFIEPGAFDPKQTSMMEAMVEQLEIKTLKVSDAEVIAELPGIEMTAPIVMGSARVVHRDIDIKVSFLGITPSLQAIEGQYAVLGRNMSDADVASQARVALLGSKIKEDLFGDEDPIGQTIRIKRSNFRVIGVLEELGSQMFLNLDEYIYIPITTAQTLLLGTDHINTMIARAVNEEVIDETIADIRLLLRDRHNIYNPEGDLTKDDFRVMSQVEAVNMLTSITSIFTLFLSGVAAIALIVGGIGIMNIMLVSVAERTREIGLRKAVGARRKDILWQFLLEATVLTVLGGIIGVILGVLFSFIGGIVLGRMLSMSWGFFISFKAIGLGLGVAVITGLAFGIYPARKAARLSPIEALRYE
jgi:putative ABC transport system permease protein